MGYYHYNQRWRSHRATRSTTAKRHPNSAYSQSLAYVKAQFLDLSPSTFESLAIFYSKKYGAGAGSYLGKAYPEWQTGNRKMASQTEKRILQCVPPFLPREKQFKILSFYVPQIIEQQRDLLRTPEIPFSGLRDTYSALATAVKEKKFEIDWFVVEVFGAEEVT
ncbi:MAG: hypothetical protein IT364_07220, partial [Candidatus Hydrogenedentes bacterium]|nr:hypothetical protein [Candidatus Hydrogenedentota bacterium]